MWKVSSPHLSPLTPGNRGGGAGLATGRSQAYARHSTSQERVTPPLAVLSCSGRVRVLALLCPAYGASSKPHCPHKSECYRHLEAVVTQTPPPSPPHRTGLIMLAPLGPGETPGTCEREAGLSP